MRSGRTTALAAAIAVAALPLAAVAAAPGAMTAAQFLARVDRLRAKGPLALLSGDIGKLKAEAMAAGNAYKARMLNDQAAGRPPHSCPPRKVSFGSRQLMAQLRGYSPEERTRTTLTQAIADWFAKTYPCR